MKGRKMERGEKAIVIHYKLCSMTVVVDDTFTRYQHEISTAHNSHEGEIEREMMMMMKEGAPI